MKKTLIALCALAIVGCSSTNTSNVGIEPSKVEALKETRLSTDFTRQGVRVTYTFSGEVEKVEAFGYAYVWRDDYRIAAEADAKDKLIKFLRGESVDSNRVTKVISKSIERNLDHTVNKFKTVDGTINTTDVDIEKQQDDEKTTAEDGTDKEENTKSNTATRKASVYSAQLITSTITVQSKGRLSGVIKDRGGVIDDGKVYQVVYLWSPKNQKAARTIVSIMDGK